MLLAPGFGIRKSIAHERAPAMVWRLMPDAHHPCRSPLAGDAPGLAPGYREQKQKHRPRAGSYDGLAAHARRTPPLQEPACGRCSWACAGISGTKAKASPASGLLRWFGGSCPAHTTPCRSPLAGDAPGLAPGYREQKQRHRPRAGSYTRCGSWPAGGRTLCRAVPAQARGQGMSGAFLSLLTPLHSLLARRGQCTPYGAAPSGASTS